MWLFLVSERSPVEKVANLLHFSRSKRKPTNKSLHIRSSLTYAIIQQQKNPVFFVLGNNHCQILLPVHWRVITMYNKRQKKTNKRRESDDESERMKEWKKSESSLWRRDGDCHRINQFSYVFCVCLWWKNVQVIQMYKTNVVKTKTKLSKHSIV